MLHPSFTLIGAVFGSWNNARAIAYRKLNNIPESDETNNAGASTGTITVDVEELALGVPAKILPDSADRIAIVRGVETYRDNARRYQQRFSAELGSGLRQGFLFIDTGRAFRLNLLAVGVALVLQLGYRTGLWTIPRCATISWRRWKARPIVSSGWSVICSPSRGPIRRR